MDFYLLVPAEVEAGTELPYVVTFKRTSLKAGKKLAMQMFVRNFQAGKVPAAIVHDLSGKSVQNDDGEYVVSDVTKKRSYGLRTCSWSKMVTSSTSWKNESGCL